MSTASDLIERLEKETGQRIDANEGDNLAMAGLFGAVARLIGKTPPNYTERDDVAVGVVLQHQASPEAIRQREADGMLVAMLQAGFSPDDVGIFFRK